MCSTRMRSPHPSPRLPVAFCSGSPLGEYARGPLTASLSLVRGRAGAQDSSPLKDWRCWGWQWSCSAGRFAGQVSAAASPLLLGNGLGPYSPVPVSRPARAGSWREYKAACEALEAEPTRTHERAPLR